jgi:endonuclease/exonuclease/phosphatase (EEP) superfamily protein YafD
VKIKIGIALKQYSVAAFWVYFTLFLVWVVGHFLTGDRYPPFVFLNAFALYLFMPLPLSAVVAYLNKRKELWIGFAVGAALFILFWGRLFIPPASTVDETIPTLTVMTYNVLGTKEDARPAMEILHNTDVDIVFIQEVNQKLASAIEEELSEIYPYQVLDPIDGVAGMGMLSKLPLKLTDETLQLNWVGKPQILKLEWADGQLTLVNFHMWPLGLGTFRAIDANSRAREAQALFLDEFARQAAREGPVIVAGDANATPQSDTYGRMVSFLEDSWMEGGFGFGHTYPGTNVPGFERPQLYGLTIPRWLFRIDYIFHSTHLTTLQANIAQFDENSDHRGVIATLTLNE